MSLDIEYNTIKMEGSKLYSESIDKLYNITNLSIYSSNNQISVEGTRLLLESLGKLVNRNNLTLTFILIE